MILRELLVKLGLEVDEASFTVGQLAANALTKGFEKLVDGVKETAQEFVHLVKETAASGKALEEASQTTGLTTDALQQLRHAAQVAGVSTELLDVGIFHLSRSMTAAKQGGEEQAGAFRKLGVHVTDAHGKLKDTDEVLTELAESFKKMPDGLDKTNLAMQVFGRSGARLIPLLNKGKEGLAELRGEAFVMSKEQIDAGKELVVAQMELKETTENLWKSAIAPLLPALTDLVKVFLKWRKENAEIMKQRIQTLFVKPLVFLIRSLTSAFVGMLKIAKTVSKFFHDNLAPILGIVAGVVLALIYANRAWVASMLYSGEVAVVTALKTAAAWAIAAAPFIAIGAAIAALLLVYDDLRVYAKGGDSLFGRFKKQIDQWAEPKTDDPWWLRAIKQLVHYLEMVPAKIDEFKKKIDDAWASVVRFGGTVAAGARAAASTVVGGARAVGSAVSAGAESVANFVAPSAPSAPPRAGSGGNVFQSNVTVHAAPGMSAEDVANMVQSKQQDFWQSSMEDAAAAVGY